VVVEKVVIKEVEQEIVIPKVVYKTVYVDKPVYKSVEVTNTVVKENTIPVTHKIPKIVYVDQEVKVPTPNGCRGREDSRGTKNKL